MDSPGKDTGVGSHFLLQGIFPTQGSNLWSLPGQVGSLQTEPPGKPKLANERHSVNTCELKATGTEKPEMLLHPGQKSEHFEKDMGLLWASFVAQLVKNLPAMQETPVQFLVWEDPLEKGKATYSSILA